MQFQENLLLLDIVDPAGKLVGRIDFSSSALDQIVCVTYFNPDDPSGGEFLVLGGLHTNLALVTDFLGNVKSQFNYRATLGSILPSDISAITSGPQKGALSLMDSNNSELVVFTLP